MPEENRLAAMKSLLGTVERHARDLERCHARQPCARADLRQHVEGFPPRRGLEGGRAQDRAVGVAGADQILLAVLVGIDGLREERKDEVFVKETTVSLGLSGADPSDGDKSPNTRGLHRRQQAARRVREEADRRATAESKRVDHGVLPAKVRTAEVRRAGRVEDGGHHACGKAGLALAGLGGDGVSAFQRALHEFAANGAGRAEDEKLHGRHPHAMRQAGG